MGKPNIDVIRIGPGAGDFPAARRILKRLPGSAREPAQGDAASPGPRTLELTRFQGHFLKPCPGTPEYLCCGYRILNIGANCPLDCSYCVLQAYFESPHLQIYVNLEEALGGVLAYIDRHSERFFRIGTGEFTDSLALDGLTGWSRILLAAFSRCKNAVLELKTKTAAVGPLLRTPHRERIVVAWSLNSPHVARHEEKGAPRLGRRLQAARRCQEEGFALAFHFDPLIAHPGWQESYRRSVDLLARHIQPKNIAWISLGSFRFMPALKAIIRRKHPQSRILKGEFVTGLDGKLRYFKPIRMEMYAFMHDLLTQWCEDPGLYLCMESPEVWRHSLGWSPEDSAQLAQYLDRRARRIFG